MKWTVKHEPKGSTIHNPEGEPVAWIPHENVNHSEVDRMIAAANGETP